MSAIIDFLRKLLSLFFGSSSSNETPTETPDQPKTETDQIETPSVEIPPKEEETQTDESETQEPETESEEEPEATGPILDVTLSRYSRGTNDILGKLKVGEIECETLESLSGIPVGEYSLALRTEGGRHATYWYKFGDIHKGMLWIKNVPNKPFPDIHIGNTFQDAQGGIVVGTQVHNGDQTDDIREVWYSEVAYEKVYTPMAEHLDQGGRVILKITE